MIAQDAGLTPSFCLLAPDSAVLQQQARQSAAALLAPLTHLPPTMVIPGKKTVNDVEKGKTTGVNIENNIIGEE